MSVDFDTDVVIVGCGPVGLAAIFTCGLVGLSCHAIDALPYVGGQCSALYAEKPIFDICGIPEILAGSLVKDLLRQAQTYNPVFHLEQKATKLEKIATKPEKAADGIADGFEITTSKGTVIKTRFVIISSGGGELKPRKLPIARAAHYENKSLFYQVSNVQDMAGRNLVIVGGGDSAIDWAILLHKMANSVTIVNRRAQLRAMHDSQQELSDLITAGAINMVTPFQIEDLIGDDSNGVLQTVVIKDPSGNLDQISADTVLAFFGLESKLGEIADWGLEMQKNRIVITPISCRTNIDRVYAIGDIATYHDHRRLKLIACGFAEAFYVAQDIKERI